jgi:hypothetical protein
VFEVWADNWPAWEIFESCETQWRVAPMGGVLGLEYPAVEILIRAAGHPLRLLKDVQTIERAAVREIHRLQEENGS